MKIKEQTEAIEKRIQKQKITLNEKVLKGIENMKLNESITLNLKGKVVSISEDYDYDTIGEIGENSEKMKTVRIELDNIK